MVVHCWKSSGLSSINKIMIIYQAKQSFGVVRLAPELVAMVSQIWFVDIHKPCNILNTNQSNRMPQNEKWIRKHRQFLLVDIELDTMVMS